jgi:glycosyltransferase involved in cell wall biosynthesis
LEAAAQGAPIIISESGTMREYFEDLAYYINPNDSKDIIRGIESVLQCDKKSIRIPRSMVHSKYSLEHVALTLSGLYRRVVVG